MPLHDWTRVDAGLFHAFHQSWTVALQNALNGGVLPPEYMALVEQNIRGPIPDVLTLKLSFPDDGPMNGDGQGGVAVATRPPKARFVRHSDATIYAGRANQIAVRHRHGDVVAVIEIISPGNKSSKSEFKTFIRKSKNLLTQGIHLLAIDLFPPGKRDPDGIHAAIWSDFEEDGDALAMPADKPLTFASYDAGPPPTAYIEPAAVGDEVPDLPLFLQPETYVTAPLRASYETTWQSLPTPVKRLVAPA